MTFWQSRRSSPASKGFKGPRVPVPLCRTATSHHSDCYKVGWDALHKSENTGCRKRQGSSRFVRTSLSKDGRFPTDLRGRQQQFLFSSGEIEDPILCRLRQDGIALGLYLLALRICLPCLPIVEALPRADDHIEGRIVMGAQ